MVFHIDSCRINLILVISSFTFDGKTKTSGNSRCPELKLKEG